MKIKATQKLLNVSGMRAVKDFNPGKDDLPGEWFASLVSTGSPGKLAVHFLHYPSLISAIIPGRSLRKVLPLLPGRISSLLARKGFSHLEPGFQLHTTFEIYSTDSRSQLAYMRDLKFNIEYHLAKGESTGFIDYEKVEDICFMNLFGGKLAENKYVRPEEILSRMSGQQ